MSNLLNRIRIGALGFKILGWFWLTLFVSYGIASFAAYMFPIPAEQRGLPSEDRESISVVAHLIVEHVSNTDEDITQQRDDRFVDWAIFSLAGDLQIATADVPEDGMQLIAHYDWQLGPTELLTSHHVLTGPQAVHQGDEQVLVLFWRARYPRLIDRIRSLPAWFPLLLSIMATLAMSLLFYRSIVKPLQRISTGFATLSRGDLSYRIGKHKRHDEFGELYDNFDRMAGHLASLITSHNRLSADISHELKTPLSRLQMALALARSAPPEQLEKYLDRAEGEGEKLDDLIKQLLQLAEIKSRPFNYSFESIGADELLKELADDAGFEADALNLSYTQQINVEQPLLLNSRLILMALENLVRNAFKYARTEVKLRVYTTQDQVVFEVSDDGPGVAESDIERLQQAFYRADQSRDRDTGGVGLGLAIAGEAAAVHGGELDIVNLDVQGLCARLRVPLRRAA